jgi:uncharacterized membrane protein YhaH (DUF805 family)
MQEYIAMWKNFANFNDRTSVRGYWMAFLVNFVIGLVLSAIIGIIPQLGFVNTLYSLASLIPGLAICVRRLNDSGRPWYNLFWAFLPLAGFIILIVKFCKPSIAEEIPGKVTV